MIDPSWAEQVELRMRHLPERHRQALLALLRAKRITAPARLLARRDLDEWLSDGDGTPLPRSVVDYSNKTNRGIDKRTGRHSHDLPGGTERRRPSIRRFAFAPEPPEFQDEGEDE